MALCNLSACDSLEGFREQTKFVDTLCLSALRSLKDVCISVLCFFLFLNTTLLTIGNGD